MVYSIGGNSHFFKERMLCFKDAENVSSNAEALNIIPLPEQSCFTDLQKVTNTFLYLDPPSEVALPTARIRTFSHYASTT